MNVRTTPKHGRIAGLPHSCRNACRRNAVDGAFLVVDVEILEITAVCLQFLDPLFG
jgi:hypothetical protein